MKSIDKSDHDFERALLHSASGDAPDADAGERAWMRFTTLTANIAGAKAVSSGVPTAPRTTKSVGRVASVVTAAKWVMLGAIAGSAMTFALIAHRVPAQPRASAPLVPTAQTVAAAAPSPVVARPILQTESSAAVVDPPPSASGATALHSSARNSGLGLVSVTEASSLAAEVAALDAARSALDTGGPDDALALLGRYLREFPKGKLVPEAEVMAIEAQAVKGERARVIRDATRFLDRHPNAPERTRVEQLRSQTAQE
ncbi:MAG: hypothetical protein M3O50_01040 [Myxococcota bacterium]|nr:hypothetical protein [Myxococcota bacterium]